MSAIGKTFWTVFEDFDEAISPGLYSYFRVGIARDVAHFVRVFIEVEKVFFARLGIPDVFVVAIRDIVVAVIGGITARVFSV